LLPTSSTKPACLTAAKKCALFPGLYFLPIEAESVEWTLKNSTSSMTLEYPPKEDSLTKKFLNFIFENPGSTIIDFYSSNNFKCFIFIIVYFK
jgi:hypothetical protein